MDASIGNTYLAAHAAAQAAPARVPVPDAVTARILDLLSQAADALAQAAYEGNHVVRQDPAPVYGSPWQTPDLPADLYARVVAIHTDVQALRRDAHAAHHLPAPTVEV